MNDVSDPVVMTPFIVKCAPYTTTAPIESVDAADTVPENIPTTNC